MKPIKFEQLLFIEDKSCFSLYLKAINDQSESDFLSFWQRMLDVMAPDQEIYSFLRSYDVKILRILKTQPLKQHAFFFSKSLIGFISFDHKIDNFYLVADFFHVRPLLEEFFYESEYAFLSLGKSEVRLFLGDSKQLDLIEIFSMSEITQKDPQNFFLNSSELVNHREAQKLKWIAEQLLQRASLANRPLIISGEEKYQSLFLRFYKSSKPRLTWHENLSLQSCSELLRSIYLFKTKVNEMLADEMKDNVKRWFKSGRLCTDFEEIIKLIKEEKIKKLFLPLNIKIWGTINFDTLEYSIEAKPHKGLKDLYSVLAEEVYKTGGEIQFLSPHFFSGQARLMALKKQDKKWNSIHI